MIISIAKLATGGWMRYVLIVLSVVISFIGVYVYGYNVGEDDTRHKYEAVIAEEQKRLAKEKRDALEDAARRIEHLETVISVRDATLERLIDEASQDPNADNGAISDDSVRRLNRVR